MPKMHDISKILIIGSGPIVIGQGCEFDYSGTQACKALQEEGYTVVLVNSNPATIMTDPSIADATYIEPLTVEALTAIIEAERPCALLPTLGGQTGLNLAMTLSKSGVLAKWGVRMLGATESVIERAEDRKLFKKIVEELGLLVPKSKVAYTLDEAKSIANEIGFPCVVRPAFTLGGTGGGIAYNVEEVETISGYGLQASLISEILIEESVIGWKEYELEVMRDRADNVVIVCTIENMDPMGVHTGDSITVAPAQTLSDREYQAMRDAGIAIIRAVGVETGGSNIQFAINPHDGRMVVIEMNPRVSRSSALASKATGFPIAKLAAKLAVGYTLDELPNDITRKTPASFEPVLDYCVVKIPRFNFDKFSVSKPVLGTAMKSVGEIMAIGRTFKSALQKGCRSLETKRHGIGFDGLASPVMDDAELNARLATPNPDRLFYIVEGFSRGISENRMVELTKIDPWFLRQIQQLVAFSKTIQLDVADITRAKQWGFSDIQLAHILDIPVEDVRKFRYANGILPTYKLVDTCAAEFESETPYFYSTYEWEDESRVTSNPKVMILGSGPNRIGQGIEFDYACVHASLAVREIGYESIMVNSNPETVSTDYDISDKLYFEPLTVEDVFHIYEREKPLGVIVQFGGQTPLNLAAELDRLGVKILGTSVESIATAENRDLFLKRILALGLRQPKSGIAYHCADARTIAAQIGYPILIRPSFVLGGASMRIVYSESELRRVENDAFNASAGSPVLIDQYLENAIEVDVDALSDGIQCRIAGVMEHVEEAGVHSGDSACALPPHSLPSEIIAEIEAATAAIAKDLNVIGLLNIQFAVKDSRVYVLEVNPRASRTVPFVSKATGIPWAQLATKVMLGHSIESLNIPVVTMNYTAVKEAVFPFSKFPGVDVVLGPEMRSTGEVMGIDYDYGNAYIKAQLASGQKIPRSGNVFLSLKDRDKPKIVEMATQLTRLGYRLVGTRGTSAYLRNCGLDIEPINKVSEARPHVVDWIKNGDIHLVINTQGTTAEYDDGLAIRLAALAAGIPIITTVSGAYATVNALDAFLSNPQTVTTLQAYYQNRP